MSEYDREVAAALQISQLLGENRALLEDVAYYKEGRKKWEGLCEKANARADAAEKRVAELEAR